MEDIMFAIYISLLVLALPFTIWMFYLARKRTVARQRHLEECLASHEARRLQYEKEDHEGRKRGDLRFRDSEGKRLPAYGHQYRPY